MPGSQTRRVKKPVALVTGASGGLGPFVVRAFASGGYRVSATGLQWGRTTDRAAALTSTADLTNAREAAAVVRETTAKLGPVACVLHLAGAFDGGMRIEQTSDAIWDEMLNVNVRTAVNVMRAAIPEMRARRSGRIVVVGSTAALHPVATWSAFSASVAALAALVQTAGAELRGSGVTVNAVLPTTIDTPAVRSIVGNAEADRSVPPQSLASLMLWLCSPDGGHMNGALLPVGAGQPHPCHEWHGETDS